MKKIVLTIQEDVCVANGKDVNATDLITAMKKWGTIEDYDDCIADVKKEYQANLDNTLKQYNEIKEQKLTPDELALVIAHRSAVQNSLKGVQAENAKCKAELERIVAEQQARIKRVVDTLTELATNN